MAKPVRCLARWLDEIANQRVHGTTHQVPRELFELEETALLGGLPPRRWQSVVWKRARVHRASHVEFERRLYSVPFRLMGQTVLGAREGQHGRRRARLAGRADEIFAERDRKLEEAREKRADARRKARQQIRAQQVS